MLWYCPTRRDSAPTSSGRRPRLLSRRAVSQPASSCGGSGSPRVPPRTLRPRPRSRAPLDALAVATGSNVTIAYLMAFRHFRPRPVGVAIQGGYTHVLVDRVRGVLAHIAVDPGPASAPRHLAYAPKGVLLASSAPYADPVGLGPIVSP